MRGAAELTVWN